MTQAVVSAFPDDSSSSPAPAGMWLPAVSLWRREMVRFVRQRSRVVGAFAQPLLFWVVLGSGVGTSLHLHGSAGSPDAAATPMNFLVYFYPGTIVMMLLFTAIFSTISVIEDRREGFLQGVLVAPVPRLAIVLGKVLGGATIGLVQGLILLAAWPLIGHWPGWVPMLEAVGVMALLALALTALGLCVAWPMRSTAGFHSIMMLFLLPMWMLSGALFPMSGASFWLRGLMWSNPLMYGYAAFSALLTGSSQSAGVPMDLLPAVAVTVVFTLVMLSLAVVIVRRPGTGGV